MGNSARPSIFIGNGINEALKKIKPDAGINFDYESIFKAVLKKLTLENNLELCDFLNHAEDNNKKDLEYLLMILKNSIECLKYTTKHYCKPVPSFSETIDRHRTDLKRIVIEILTNKNFHPSYKSIFGASDEPPDYIIKCGKNLSGFERIFTINYDLILYWLLNNQELLSKSTHAVEENHKIGSFRDGFTPENYCLNNQGDKIDHLFGLSMNNNHPNLFYLHGAIHLVQKNNSAFKIVKRGDKSHLSLEDLKGYLLSEYSGLDNLIIFDATSDDKISNIVSNSYLNKAYDKITPIKGDIIIYGCNFHENEKVKLGNDLHLWQKIVNSDTKNIYASIEAKDKLQLNRCASELGECLKKYIFKLNIRINIYCFSYEVVDIWKSTDFFEDIVYFSSDPYELSNGTE